MEVKSMISDNPIEDTLRPFAIKGEPNIIRIALFTKAT
jgi:hypothetical protein